MSEGNVLLRVSIDLEARETGTTKVRIVDFEVMLVHLHMVGLRNYFSNSFSIHVERITSSSIFIGRFDGIHKKQKKLLIPFICFSL